MKVYELIDLFCCPDCRGKMYQHNQNLQCKCCKRVFNVYKNICVDFIPKRKFVRCGKTGVERRSIEVYNKLFDEKFDWKESPKPWGLYIPEKYLKKFYKHKYMVYKLINIINAKAIDISAGSGRFSWDLVDRFSFFVFCDLSVDSAIFLTERAIREGKKNVLIVRCDYFSPPFNEEVFDL